MRLACPVEGSYRAFEYAPISGILIPVPQTVLIVDDHAGFRHAARALLEADGYDVIGESATGSEGLEAVAGCARPRAARRRPARPRRDRGRGRLTAVAGGGPAVVLTSSRDASDYPPHFEHCGARGFIAKAELSGDALAMLAA